ncbi:hypothetical protein, partial [Staphylococcus aureus]
IINSFFNNANGATGSSTSYGNGAYNSTDTQANGVVTTSTGTFDGRTAVTSTYGSNIQSTTTSDGQGGFLINWTQQVDPPGFTPNSQHQFA